MCKRVWLKLSEGSGCSAARDVGRVALRRSHISRRNTSLLNLDHGMNELKLFVLRS